MSVRMGRSEREWLAYLLALCAVIKIRIWTYRTVAAKRRQTSSYVRNTEDKLYSLVRSPIGPANPKRLIQSRNRTIIDMNSCSHREKMLSPHCGLEVSIQYKSSLIPDHKYLRLDVRPLDCARGSGRVSAQQRTMAF
ncbi:hypothetical protein JOM56_006801 [Amanita muscaria]